MKPSFNVFPLITRSNDLTTVLMRVRGFFTYDIGEVL